MTRVGIGALGLALGVYGGFLLLNRQDIDQLASVAIWLGAGVVLHDLVLAPLVIVLLAVAARMLPQPARAPVAVGFVVLGTVTLLGVPVLGRFGARPDNPTLLDRPYAAGWLVLAGLTVAGVMIGVVVASLLRRRRADGR